ncbi:unnamed protein product [Durusdinium trenchii]|uniref:Plasma membrane-associated coenzyme Q6 reductase PGA3 n=2 Tax=Durusdinium trenchii TaxID=1381693 RepID=A0ABP0JFC6_9DINO
MDDEDYAMDYACARLEASLGLHKAKIETLRKLEKRLDARVARLGELSLAAKTLVDSMMRNPFQAADDSPLVSPSVSFKDSQEKQEEKEEEKEEEKVEEREEEKEDGDRPKNQVLKRSVSWVSEPPHEEVLMPGKDSPDAHRIPPHGHWVPSDVLERRSSFQGESAKKLGGRQVELRAGESTVPCILVEPMGKLINNEFVSTGMAVVFEETHAKSTEEWAQVLKRTKLLDAGVSVAIPLLKEAKKANNAEETETLFNEASLKDLHDLVGAIMAMCSSDLCILCGKGPGAQKAMEVAPMIPGTAASILFAPSSPPPTCSFMGPVMLVWAQDDTESPFENAGFWAEALANREESTAVAVLRDPAVGGHDLSRMLRKDDACAADVLSFVAAALLITELRRFDHFRDQRQPGDGQANLDALQSRLLKLFEELPLHLTCQFVRQRVESNPAALEGKHADDLAMALVSHFFEKPDAAPEIAGALSDWINGDMPSVASASE